MKNFNEEVAKEWRKELIGVGREGVFESCGSPAHLNPPTRREKPRRRRSFDTSRGSWRRCRERRKNPKLRRLASGWLFVWRAAVIVRKKTVCTRTHAHRWNNMSSNACQCSELAVFEKPEGQMKRWHLAVAALDHLVLQQPRQLAEEDAVVQHVHQAVSCEVRAWEHSHNYSHCALVTSVSPRQHPDLCKRTRSSY